MTRLNAPPYDYTRSSGRCAATDRPLLPGQPIVVALVEPRPDAGTPGTPAMERCDYAADAWTPALRRELGPRLFAFWRTVQAEPTAKPRLLVDDDSLLEIFHALGDETAEVDAARMSDEDRAQVAFRFVLALILCRKRLLRHEGTEPSQGDRAGCILVRERGSDPALQPIRVLDPGSDNAALSRATDRLSEVLRGQAEA